MLLTGAYSVQRIYDMAAGDLGLNAVTKNERARSKFYTLFRNPFYYGAFEYNGQLYQGKHEPMITKREFDRAQDILDGKAHPKPETHEFAFTGLIRCGECGCMITAEEKLKKQKNGNTHHYTYYRCTKRKLPCSQKTIRLEELEKQIQETLSSIEIPREFVEWAVDCIKTENSVENQSRDKLLKKRQSDYDAVLSKMDRLLDLRLGGEITDEEFKKKKEEFATEKNHLSGLLQDQNGRVDNWMDYVEEALNFAHKVPAQFSQFSLDGKRRVLATLGSNLSLKDRKLSIPLQKVFAPIRTASAEVKILHAALEPAATPINTKDFRRIYDESPVLGG
jgi:hypothetical protein